MKTIVIFDNNGETFDRFTIIDKKSGDMIGASDNPFHPQGFGQYCGNPAYTFFCKTGGAGWISQLYKEDHRRYSKIIKDKTKEIIEEFKSDGHLGQIVEFSTLPENVKKFIIQSFSN